MQTKICITGFWDTAIKPLDQEVLAYLGAELLRETTILIMGKGCLVLGPGVLLPPDIVGRGASISPDVLGDEVGNLVLALQGQTQSAPKLCTLGELRAELQDRCILWSTMCTSLTNARQHLHSRNIQLLGPRFVYDPCVPQLGLFPKPSCGKEDITVTCSQFLLIGA